MRPQRAIVKLSNGVHLDVSHDIIYKYAAYLEPPTAKIRSASVSMLSPLSWDQDILDEEMLILHFNIMSSRYWHKRYHHPPGQAVLCTWYSYGTLSNKNSYILYGVTGSHLNLIGIYDANVAYTSTAATSLKSYSICRKLLISCTSEIINVASTGQRTNHATARVRDQRHRWCCNPQVYGSSTYKVQFEQNP